jgi:hypothetical protein
MVCFVNVESVDRIIYSIFQRFNLEWKTRLQPIYTSNLTSLPRIKGWTNLVPDVTMSTFPPCKTFSPRQIRVRQCFP